jgi:hypothetical protein
VQETDHQLHYQGYTQTHRSSWNYIVINCWSGWSLGGLFDSPYPVAKDSLHLGWSLFLFSRHGRILYVHLVYRQVQNKSLKCVKPTTRKLALETEGSNHLSSATLHILHHSFNPSEHGIHLNCTYKLSSDPQIIHYVCLHWNHWPPSLYISVVSLSAETAMGCHCEYRLSVRWIYRARGHSKRDTLNKTT